MFSKRGSLQGRLIPTCRLARGPVRWAKVNQLKGHIWNTKRIMLTSKSKKLNQFWLLSTRKTQQLKILHEKNKTQNTKRDHNFINLSNCVHPKRLRNKETKIKPVSHMYVGIASVKIYRSSDISNRKREGRWTGRIKFKVIFSVSDLNINYIKRCSYQKPQQTSSVDSRLNNQSSW